MNKKLNIDCPPISCDSAAKWIQLKKDYETGNYTVEALSKKYEFSKHTIYQKTRKWKKGSMIPKIEEAIEKQYIKEFEKQGIDKKEIATIVADMLLAKRKNIMNDLVPDYLARSKALDHFKDFTGTRAAIKTENKNTNNITIDIKNKSDDELELELKRLQRIDADFEIENHEDMEG